MSGVTVAWIRVECPAYYHLRRANRILKTALPYDLLEARGLTFHKFFDWIGNQKANSARTLEVPPAISWHRECLLPERCVDRALHLL